MEITTMHIHDPLPVAVWHLQGQVAGSDEQALIDEVKRENQVGARYLVLDFAFVTCLDEAGAAALRSAAELFDPDTSNGANIQNGDGVHERIKLLHVPAEVEKVLEVTGSSHLFETCGNLRQALKSFML